MISIMDEHLPVHPFSLHVHLDSINVQNTGEYGTVENGMILLPGGSVINTIYASQIDTTLPPDLVCNRNTIRLLEKIGKEYVLKSPLAFLVRTDTSSTLKVYENRIDNLLLTFITEDSVSAISQAGELLGLGPGLTPSFDDWLCGFFACMHLLPREKRTKYKNTLYEIALAARVSTTAISANFLSHASEGRFGEQALALVKGCAYPNDIDLQNALQNLVSLGHTSGSDFLVGFLKCVQIFNEYLIT